MGFCSSSSLLPHDASQLSQYGRMDYITIEGVELLKTGTWNASTGEVVISLTDLEAMLAAWQSTKLPLPVIKLGHLDPRMENPEWDGEPVYGQVDNLSITTDDDDVSTLKGDYVNVPSTLATVMASAYPQRSVEIDWQVELVDEDGEVVESFSAVLTAVALLGATPPAVKGLASVHVDFKQRTSTLAIKAGTSSVLSARLSYPGSHTTESLRQALSEAVRNSSDGEYSWVEDFDDEHVWFTVERLENGGYTIDTYQQTYSVAEDGVITLTGTPSPVQPRHVYQPISEETLSGAQNVPHDAVKPLDGGTVDASETSKAAFNRTEEGDDMEFTEEQLKVLRQKFGLADDATGEDVLQAMDAEAEQGDGDAADSAEQDDASEQHDESDDGGEDDDADAPAEQERELVNASGTVTLSASQFADMQRALKRQGAELAEMRKEKAAERKQKAISDALSSGRIHRKDKAYWEEALERDEKSTAALLKNLTPVVPVSELGYDESGNFLESGEVLDKHTAELDDRMFSKKGK